MVVRDGEQNGELMRRIWRWSLREREVSGVTVGYRRKQVRGRNDT